MPRPKKQIDYHEEISQVEEQITRCKGTIKKLEGAKNALLQQRDQADMSRIYDAYKASGLAINEVIDRLSHPDALEGRPEVL